MTSEEIDHAARSPNCQQSFKFLEVVVEDQMRTQIESLKMDDLA
jgi:hypothetical protein